MNNYTIAELYSIYILEYKKDKPLFETVSVVDFLIWLQKKEALKTLADDADNSPFDSAVDAQADYSEEGR